MAESGPSNADEKQEPVNLLYLASTKGPDCEELRLHEQSGSQHSSLELSPSAMPDSTPPNTISPVPPTEEEVPREKGGSPDRLSPQASVPPKPKPHDAFRARQLSSQATFEEKGIYLLCPRVNCPEKIIICLDISDEMEKPTFRSRVGDKFSPIQLIKRALGIFVHSKHRIDPRHEFALVYLQDAAFWISDFTSDPSKIVTILDDMSSYAQTETFDLASIFDVICQNVELPVVSNPAIIPPPYIVRAILIYGRSHCLPKFSSTQRQKFLHTSPYFFLDAYYLHEPPSDDNQCEAVFDVLCSLDQTGLSYINEVSRNPTKLYDCMAQLLPHPLQRPIQQRASYDIQESPLATCTSGPQGQVAPAATS